MCTNVLISERMDSNFPPKLSVEIISKYTHPTYAMPHTISLCIYYSMHSKSVLLPLFLWPDTNPVNGSIGFSVSKSWIRHKLRILAKKCT